MGLALSYAIADQSLELGKSIGILNVSLNLLDQLAGHDAIESVRVLGNSNFRGVERRFDRVTLETHDWVLRGGLRRLFWEQFAVYRRSRPCDWLILPKGFASFMGRPRVPLACIVHDALVERAAERHPGMFPKRELVYFRKALYAAIRYSDLILTNSDFTRSEVLRVADKHRLKCPPVVRMGIGFSDRDRLLSTLEDQDRPREDILITTNPYAYKRSDLAVRNTERWIGENRFDGSVHLIGRLPPDLPVPDDPQWHHEDRVSYKALGRLFSRARVVVFCSEYEGFGAPPVEAVLAGACPVYSDIPATREVMGGCGYSFSNDDYDSFAEATTKAWDADPAALATWSERLRTRHNWNAVCGRVIEALRQHRP